MKRLQWSALSADEQINILKRPGIARGADIDKAAANIIAQVKQSGDQALYAFTKQFDKAELTSLRVSNEECADIQITEDAKAAIDRAYENISAFHKSQGYREFQTETMPGVNCQRIVRSLDTVGLYVPGGSAPLISTTLMLGIPAQIAACKNVILCTPCNAAGEVNSHILYAAQLCGIDKIFKVGGAQAIAAMAYGTETIPKAAKIFGPGNAYVTAAKQQVAADPAGAAIDIPAGPSEVLVIVDDTSNPAFAAADLLSQAEHDPMSQVVLVSVSEQKIEDVQRELDKQLNELLRRDIATQALENSLAILADNLDQAVEISNLYSPEHLILCFDSAKNYLEGIQNAGSVFVGQFTPESAGDYASGTNHVLPTYGYARSYSGLSVEAFQKTMTVQSLTEEGLQNLGDTIEILADLEGLDAHARAVSIRRKN